MARNLTALDYCISVVCVGDLRAYYILVVEN
jgi:hypothetical protein